MSRGKRVLVLLIMLMIFFNLSSAVFAHGGEDHSEEKQSPVASIGQMNVKLARTDNLEILVKYPNPKFGEETLLRVFITELKTNTPVAGVNIALALSHAGKTTGDSNKIVALPTSTPGIYEARLTFPDAGQYNLLLQLAGQNINEQVTVSGIAVPAKAADGAAADRPGSTSVMLALALLLFSAIAAGYLFWLRPRRSQQIDTEARGQITL
jgi:hypothetical protein